MASNDARIQISQNNAQLRYQAEVQAEQNKETARTNRYNAFTLAADQISAIAGAKIEEYAEENTRNYQAALQDAIMSGQFEFKDRNPENGLAETWEDYWGNYQSFTEEWLGNKENLTGGLLSKAATKKAVNNYLNNSMTDIADSRKTQLWEQKVATRQNIQASLLSGVFDEEEYNSNFSSLIANDKFASLGITNMAGLYNVNDYGINEYYTDYENQKTLFENGEPSNYFESALNLQTAMRAFVGDWGQDYFKTYMNGTEKVEGTTAYNLIQATHATAEGLKDDLITLCNSTGGSLDSLQQFIEDNKIGSFIKGQNGLDIRVDGLTEEEITSANNQLSTELTKTWTALSAQNAEMYTDLYAGLVTDIGKENGPILYSVDDIINYKDQNEEKFGSLSDEYVKYQVMKNDKLVSLMYENSKKKENLEAIMVLGNAQENWNNWTAEEQAANEEEMEAARTTLWRNNYWVYASDYFNFGTSYKVGDDTGSWINERTSVIFDYMKKHDVDFVTAAIGSGFYDTYLSTGSVAGSEVSAGEFLPSQAADTGRYMENNASTFFAAAFDTDGILSHSYSKQEIEENFPTAEDKLKEAFRLLGGDTESSESGYNNLISAYKSAEQLLSVGGKVVKDETTLKAVFLNEATRLNQSKSEKEVNAANNSTLSYKMSLNYSLFEEDVNLGWMLANSSIDGSTAYNKDALTFAEKTKVSSTLTNIRKSGTKEDLENLCLLYNNKELYVAVKQADDWKALAQDETFLNELTASRCSSAVNFYTSFAGNLNLSEIDYMTATGSTASIEETIKNNVKDGYLNASDAWLRMQYKTNPAATYGKDFNGVKVAGTSIVEDGAIGSDMFKTFCARYAYATSDAEKQQILDEAKGYLCEDALKVLKSGDSLNIALQSLGVFGEDTIQSLLAKQYGTSEFGKLQNDNEYSDFAALLGQNTEFLAKIKEAKARLDAGEPEATVKADIIKFMQDCVTDYCTYSNEEKIKAYEKARNKEAGVSFSVIGSLEEYSGLKDNKKADSAHTLFSNITSNSSKLSSQYFNGDLTTRSYIDKMFISGELNANENQSSLYNLAVGISGGNVAKTDKNSLALVCGVMAYNQITGSNYQIDVTKLTSDNIKNYEEEIASYLSDLSPTSQYDWSRLQSSITTIVKTVSKYEGMGFDDVLSYATKADGSFGFVSNKSSNIKINSDGTISMVLPAEMGGGTISDVSLYTDAPNRNSVALSLFKAETVVKGLLNSPPVVKNFVSLDGVNAVKEYNNTKEYLDGKSSTDAVLVAYPVGINVSEKNVRFVIEGENAYDETNPNYYLYQVTLDTASKLYDFYTDNKMNDKVDELCSMLTDTQVKTIKTAYQQKADAKAKAEAAKKITSTTVGEPEKVEVVDKIDSDAFRAAQQYAKDHPKISTSELYQHLKSIDNKADFEDAVQGFIYEAQTSTFLKEKVEDPVAVINGYADDIRNKVWSAAGASRISERGVLHGGRGGSFGEPSEPETVEAGVQEPAVTEPETVEAEKPSETYISKVVEKYKGKDFALNNIERYLKVYYDDIDTFAEDLKAAIASGDLKLTGFDEIKNYYKDVNAYIDATVKRVKDSKNK